MSGPIHTVFAHALRGLSGAKITRAKVRRLRCRSCRMSCRLRRCTRVPCDAVRHWLCLTRGGLPVCCAAPCALRRAAPPPQVETYRNKAGDGCAVRCSYKADDGFLYPLEKAFFYVHKPPMCINHRYDARVLCGA
jgi:hypothetical protein